MSYFGSLCYGADTDRYRHTKSFVKDRSSAAFALTRSCCSHFFSLSFVSTISASSLRRAMKIRMIYANSRIPTTTSGHGLALIASGDQTSESVTGQVIRVRNSQSIGQFQEARGVGRKYGDSNYVLTTSVSTGRSAIFVAADSCTPDITNRSPKSWVRDKTKRKKSKSNDRAARPLTAPSHCRLVGLVRRI